MSHTRKLIGLLTVEDPTNIESGVSSISETNKLTVQNGLNVRTGIANEAIIQDGGTLIEDTYTNSNQSRRIWQNDATSPVNNPYQFLAASNTLPSTTSGGLVNINNTLNNGPGLVVNSANETSVSPLVKINVINSATDTFTHSALDVGYGAAGNAVLVTNNSTNPTTQSGVAINHLGLGTVGNGNGLSVTQRSQTLNSTAGTFVSDNNQDTCVGISGRNFDVTATTGRAVLKISHIKQLTNVSLPATSILTDANVALINCDPTTIAGATTTQAIGIMVNPSQATGTLGALLTLRNNNGAVRALDVLADGRSSFGASNTDASAQVGIESTTRGFLPPRMTTTQKTAIVAPATGLIVYDLTLNRPCFYNGTGWITL